MARSKNKRLSVSPNKKNNRNRQKVKRFSRKYSPKKSFLKRNAITSTPLNVDTDIFKTKSRISPIQTRIPVVETIDLVSPNVDENTEINQNTSNVSDSNTITIDDNVEKIQDVPDAVAVTNKKSTRINDNIEKNENVSNIIYNRSTAVIIDEEIEKSEDITTIVIDDNDSEKEKDNSFISLNSNNDNEIIVIDASEDCIIIEDDSTCLNCTPPSRKRKRANNSNANKRSPVKRNKQMSIVKENKQKLPLIKRNRQNSHSKINKQKSNVNVCKLNSPLGKNKQKSPVRINKSKSVINTNTQTSPLKVNNNQSKKILDNNIFGSSSDLNKNGLRLIVIDGSNVAFGHSNGRYFSSKGLKICIDYFLKRGHIVKAFIPQFRMKRGKSSDIYLLNRLVDDGFVVLTPSREIPGRRIVSYDDRYIVQCAANFDGIIVSNDNYRDLIHENTKWKETIENRLLMWTWVNDIIMFPLDPLGRRGPSLDDFLKIPS